MNGKPMTTGSKLRKTLLAWAGALGFLAAPVASHANVDPSVDAARQMLEARVAAVRATLQSTSDAHPDADPDLRVAQWLNWPNWNNWRNWGNWGNWNNWGNWGNR